MSNNKANRLLACGIAAGPVFLGIALIQAMTREGFDLTRHAISMLSLGVGGWIQTTSFLLTGALVMTSSLGLRRALRSGRGATWAPLLVAIHGVGLVGAGLFAADPALGFPPGTSSLQTPAMSWHGQLHGAAFFLAFTSLVAACFVLAVRFARAGERSRAAWSVVTGVAAPALIAIGMGGAVPAGVAFLLASAATFAWLTVICARLGTRTGSVPGGAQSPPSGV